jgi:hypothetical protein
MLQIHSIILWAKPKKEDFDTTVMRAYSTMQVLRDFGDEINPTFLAVAKKKDVEPFDWNYEGFRNLVKTGLNREGTESFPELGHSFSFFSSLNERDSAAISMTVGVTNPNFKNTLVVNLPKSLSLYDDSAIAEKLISTFKRCTTVFEPFWGCLVNKVNLRRFDEYIVNGMPSAAHWMNYWGSEIVERLNEERIKQSPTYKLDKLNGGYIVQLKNKPINDEDEDDRDIQDKANEYFDFKLS